MLYSYKTFYKHLFPMIPIETSRICFTLRRIHTAKEIRKSDLRNGYEVFFPMKIGERVPIAQGHTCMAYQTDKIFS